MSAPFVFTEEAEIQLLEIVDHQRTPLTVVAVLHGARDVERLLRRI